METRGIHILVDGWEPENKLLLTDVDAAYIVAKRAIMVGGFHPLEDVYHTFDSGGFSLVVLLKESHVSIHTYPEHEYAAIDLYGCGKRNDIYESFRYILKQFAFKNYSYKIIKRGIRNSLSAIKPEDVEPLRGGNEDRCKDNS